MAERTFNMDFKDVTKLTHQLEGIPAEVLPEVRKVVGRGAHNIKKDAQRLAPKGPHLPHFARSITYDTWETKTAAVAEIGPDKQKPQGPLATFIEYGRVGQPPHPFMAPAADAERPKFESAMEKLAARLLEQRQ